jgi:hypothetical protein
MSPGPVVASDPTASRARERRRTSAWRRLLGRRRNAIVVCVVVPVAIEMEALSTWI